MDKIKTLSLVIDWGFSRFKTWIYSAAGELISESSVFTSDICDNNIFYSEKDMLNLLNGLLSILDTFEYKIDLRIFASSQMHCLGAYSKQHTQFLSTWNDLSNAKEKNAKIVSIDGIPSLSSMPKYKIDLNGCMFSSTSLTDRYSYLRRIRIDYVSSPVALLFTDLLETKLPCSRSWWQSTGLPSSMLDMSDDKGAYLSEKPLVIEHKNITNIHEKLNSIIFFPEVGDLQASTFTSFKNHDIIINLGTGSQVIVSDSKLLTNCQFYRYWPNDRKKYLVISHIPCGRLLNEYVIRNGITFESVSSSLGKLKIGELIEYAKIFKQSILFFPGYCSYEGKYKEQTSVSIDDLAELDIRVLLSLWINQYKCIIEQVIEEQYLTSRNYSVAITGALGGMSEEFGKLLKKILPSNFEVKIESVSLPESLMEIYAKC